MKFIVDECTGPAVSNWLKELGYKVFCVYTESRELDDDSILEKANNENYILITNDKDFGEMVFRFKKLHKGIILLRLEDECADNKKKILNKVLTYCKNKIPNNFVIATEKTIRFSNENIHN
jgi:predicted nuclease of predicted toxin-antitoxin system